MVDERAIACRCGSYESQWSAIGLLRVAWASLCTAVSQSCRRVVWHSHVLFVSSSGTAILSYYSFVGAGELIHLDRK